MKDILNILKRLIFPFISIIIYFPVFGGILGAMILAAGATQTIVYFFWDILILLLSLIPSYPIGSIHFFVGFLDIPTSFISFLVLLGCFFILVGGGVFLLGVLELGKGLVNKQKLVDQGIYNIIRHPQNFGIIVFSLGLMLLIPLTWEQSYALRIGDLYSWILFSLIWLIEAKWEEERKIKTLNDDYVQYQKEVPFILPFGSIFECRVSRLINPNWSFNKRILFWISIYCCFLIFSSVSLFINHTLELTDFIIIQIK